MLISLNNPTDLDLELPSDKSFVTLIFYKVRSVALRNHDNDPSRSDLLEIIKEETLGRIRTSNGKNKIFNLTSNKQLEENQKELLRKAQDIISNPLAYEEFKKIYEQLSQNSNSSIIRGVQRSVIQTIWKRFLNLLLIIIEFIFIGFLILKIISVFPNFRYNEPLYTLISLIDINGFVAIFALLISCLQLSVSLKEK